MVLVTFEQLLAVGRGRVVEQQVAGQAEQHGVAERGAPLLQRRVAAAQLALALPLQLRRRTARRAGARPRARAARRLLARTAARARARTCPAY